MGFTIFEITTNASFNYFFSMPIWVTILSVPMLLVFSVFKHFR